MREGRALVVDDDPLVLRTLGRVVRGLGYDVVMVDSKCAAFAQLNVQSFDVVVTDLHLGTDPALLWRPLPQRAKGRALGLRW
jgi:CheY-like chemotaxis protein